MVQAVVLRDGAVLLSERRTLRGWEIPGGNLKTGESDSDALVREVREETGFEVQVLGRVGRYRRRGVLAHDAWVYRCEILGGALRTSWETPSVAWFPVDALPSTLFPWFRGPLDDCLAGAEGLERDERLGWIAVWTGMKIDMRTRLRGTELAGALQSR